MQDNDSDLDATLDLDVSELSADLLAQVSGGFSGYVAGDSIAVGVAQQLHWAHNAKVGAPSSNIVGRVPDHAGYNLVVISAGSNDPTNPRLGANLELMRRRAGGGVLWIAPVEPHARAVVNQVARAHGDHVVSFVPGRDGIHPRSYPELAHAIQRYAH